MNSSDIELAVADWLDFRRNIIVPNVSWGMGVHECDVFSLSGSGYATEVEIKVSNADLRRDARKPHQHRSGRIKYLWFAFPAGLSYDVQLVPERAGIVHVGVPAGGTRAVCEIVREPKANMEARAFTIDERLHLAHLGTMRTWSAKRTLLAICNGDAQKLLQPGGTHDDTGTDSIATRDN